MLAVAVLVVSENFQAFGIRWSWGCLCSRC